MIPSLRIRRPFAFKVAPVEVMSTMASAMPAAGAPSVAPGFQRCGSERRHAMQKSVASGSDISSPPALRLPCSVANSAPASSRSRHRFHIEPAIRDGDNDIGVAETELQETGHPVVGVGDLLADEIFARDAEMNAP